MSEYAPPFTITDKAIASIARINRLLGEFTARQELSRSPKLRRENRIRSIHSSLVIENNTLSLDEVTALLDGKRILGPPKDIREVQNAFEAYERLSEFDPYSMEDLLQAHGFMMADLVKDAGRFRTGNVGVFAGDALVHAGTPARYVPEVMADLFNWLSTTETHPLISSSVFHYEFEYIHPFSDGNGRMGRLWQSLILQRWDPLFAWLPVESLIAAHQQEYYDALGKAQAEADSTVFVEFMLDVIEETLSEQANEPINEPINESINYLTNRQGQLLALLQEDPTSTYEDMMEALGVSRSTLQRDLRALEDAGAIKRDGARKNGRWIVLGGLAHGTACGA